MNSTECNPRLRTKQRLYFSIFGSCLHKLSDLLLWPGYYSLDELVSCFMPTTAEQNQPYVRLPHLLVLPWILLPLLVITLPLSIVGNLIRLLIQPCRTKYRYHYPTKGAYPKKHNARQLNYTIATANLCLGPELLCRYNNLSENKRRAESLGISLFENQRYAINMKRNGMGDGTRQAKLGTAMDFPSLDILCMQEIFDASCAKAFIKEIEDVFPYVVYDAGKGWISNSGLVVASRHEVMHVDYQEFPESLGVHRLAATGVLMCKVCLGRDARTGRSSVGYVSTTHLQPYCGHSTVIRSQLTSLYRFVTSFRAQTVSPDENVMFDVIAADLNFDNMSPADEELTNHPIFSQYTDVCRLGPGSDRNWAVGTERRHRTLHSMDTSTAEGLKQCLDDQYLCPFYIFDADVPRGMSVDPWAMPEIDEDGELLETPLGGRRRIDYCLYRNEDSLVVTGYNFVTQFGNLTDHIPVSMTIMAPQL